MVCLHRPDKDRLSSLRDLARHATTWVRRHHWLLPKRLPPGLLASDMYYAHHV